MPTKFKVWVDNPTDSNTLDFDSFNEDAQRQSGFSSGTAASSTRMNTILRQNSLFCTAFMEILDGSATIDFRTSVDTLKSHILNSLSLASSIEYNDEELALTVEYGISASEKIVETIDLSSILTKTIARSVADKNGNDITTTYATKSYVANAINDAIGDVLNSDF